MRVKRVSTAAALVLLATSCLTVQAASALEPGVHIDPGSPAAKEYALPLNQARQTGAESTSPGSSETPFGAGIKPPGSGGSSGSGGSNGGSAGHGSGSASHGASSAHGGASGQGAAGASGAQLPPAVQRAVDAERSGEGGGSLPVLIGGGVAILALGAFGGTVLRHSRRPLLRDDHAH